MNTQESFASLGCGYENNTKGLGWTYGQDPKPCNWLCRNLGTIGALVSIFSPPLGAAIIGIHQIIKNVDFSKGGSIPQDYPISAAEEQELDYWATNMFNPFYESLLKSVTNLNMAHTNGIPKLNAILQQICAIKTYLIAIGKTPQGSLSINAVINRSNYVYILLDELQKEINKKVGFAPNAQYSYVLSSINLQTIGFDNSQMNQTFTCLGYTANTTTNDAPPTNTNDIIFTPPIKTPVNTNTTDVLDNTNTSVPISSEPVSTINTTKKSYTWLLVLLGLGAAYTLTKKAKK